MWVKLKLVQKDLIRYADFAVGIHGILFNAKKENVATLWRAHESTLNCKMGLSYRLSLVLAVSDPKPVQFLSAIGY